MSHIFIPIHHLWWLAAGGGAGYGARRIKLRIDLALANRRRRRLPDPTGNLLRLQTLYGYNAHSLVSIAPGASVWSTPEIDGAIIYGEFGRVWLAAGDPLAAVSEMSDLACQFAKHAHRKNRVVAFVPASAEFARQLTQRDFTAVKVGAAPYFDLKNWNPRGDAGKKIRSGVNQARRAGVSVEMEGEIISDELKKAAASLCLRWLKRRRAATALGWLLALDPFQHSSHKRYFTARVNGKLVGILAASPMPARQGWYLEDVLAESDAPQGTSTLLVFEALMKLKTEGAALATLGTSPLARDGLNDVPTEHRMVKRALDVASKRLAPFYDFAGLRRFKGKFAPSRWESEYVLAQRGVTIPPRVAHAIVRALVPGGVTHMLTRRALRAVRNARVRPAG